MTVVIVGLVVHDADVGNDDDNGFGTLMCCCCCCCCCWREWRSLIEE